MHRDACNDVTADRDSTTIEAFQVPGSKFCPAVGRDAYNDMTVDRDFVTVAYVLGSEFLPLMCNDVNASILTLGFEFRPSMHYDVRLKYIQVRPCMGRVACRGDHG